MESSNPIVAKAINAFDFEKYPHDKKVADAYKMACARSATSLLSELKRFQYDILNPKILHNMPENFQKFYYSIAGMEADIKSFLSLCKV